MATSEPVRVDRADERFTAWTDLLALLHLAFAYQDSRIDPPSSLHVMNEAALADKAMHEQLIVARRGHVLVGCAFAKIAEDRVYVGKLAVLPELQGRGVGRQLMAAVEELACEHGRRLIELQTRIELEENHEVFRKLGFSKVSESAHPGYERSTSITMHKQLRAPTSK